MFRLSLIAIAIVFCLLALPVSAGECRSIGRLQAGDAYDPDFVAGDCEHSVERSRSRSVQRGHHHDDAARIRALERDLARLENRNDYERRVERSRSIDHHDRRVVAESRSRDRRFFGGRSRSVDRQRSRSVEAY